MSDLSMNNVVIQEIFYSDRARGKYRRAPQRRGVGSMDLTYIDSKEELEMEWKDYVGLCGTFALVARDNRGCFAKCIAIIDVHESGISFRDNRCTLAAILRHRSKKKYK